MTTPFMTFEEVRAALKQRFPMIMVDLVLSLEPGKSIRTAKNVTGNEIQFLGHFPEYAVMPGTLIVEAIGQSASILFAKHVPLRVRRLSEGAPCLRLRSKSMLRRPSNPSPSLPVDRPPRIPPRLSLEGTTCVKAAMEVPPSSPTRPRHRRCRQTSTTVLFLFKKK